MDRDPLKKVEDKIYYLAAFSEKTCYSLVASRCNS